MIPGLNGLAGRIVYAILAGVITFIVMIILAAIVAYFNTDIAGILRQFAALVGLLVGLVYFFVGPRGVPQV